MEKFVFACVIVGTFAMLAGVAFLSVPAFLAGFFVGGIVPILSLGILDR